MLPCDMVSRVQACENTIAEPQELAGQMTSTDGVVHFTLAIVLVCLMGGEVED